MKRKQQKSKNLETKSCGAGKSAFLIPQFIFNTSCSKHDNYYSIGGGIIEKVKADTFFYAFMLDDISKGNYSFFRRFFYFKMATLYFVCVSTFGCFAFNWHINKVNPKDK